MKQLNVLALLFMLSISLGAQSLFEDAWELKDFFSPNGKRLILVDNRPEVKKRVAEILSKYTNQENIQAAFENNKFFTIETVPNRSSVITRDQEAVKNIPTGPQSAVTFIADGLAKFIAERTKQELTNSFFRKFKSDLDKFPILNTLLPSTALMLHKIDKDIYFFDQFIDQLRVSFIQDLERLPTGLREMVLADNSKLGPGEQLWVADLLQASQLIVDGFDFTASLDYLASDQTLMANRVNTIFQDTADFVEVCNFRAGLKTSHLLMKALLVNPESDSSWWIQPKKLFQTLNNPISRDIALGLLYEKAKDINFRSANRDTLNLQEVLGTIKAESKKMDQLVGNINNLLSNLRDVQSGIRQIKNLNPGEQDKFATYYHFLNSIIGVYQSGTSIKGLVQVSLDGKENKPFFVFSQLNELQMNLRSKKYSIAVINVGNIIDTLSWQVFQKRNKDGKETPAKSSFSSYFWRYGSFMAAVAEAKNSDEVAYAIDRIALPPGSAAMKKSSAFSLMINAYGGVSAGVEFLGQGIGQDRDAKTLLAPWAPLGFDLSFGNKKRNASTGLFLPFIDVGALAAFRLGDTQSADVPQLNWSNIIAPGAYLVFGFSKAVPISLSIGGQLGPNLRKVNVQGITLDDQRGYRIGATLAIDIPVLRLAGGQ